MPRERILLNCADAPPWRRDVSSIGAVAPIGNGLGRLTDPLNDTA